MKKYGHRQGNADHTLFIKHKHGKVTLLIIYVDDMIVTGDDTMEIERLQGHLSFEFEMKDLGGLKYFLGIEVLGLMKEYTYLKESIDWTFCLKLDHMAAVMRILSYLKRALGKGLMYRKHGHMEVKGYTDADWARNITDRRSTSRYFTFVAGNLVTWRSKKQNVVARSSAEAEYREMAHAREIANNPVHHDRTKHVELVDIPFMKIEEQLANILTHAVSARRFQDSLDKLGLGDIYAPT
ncbi:unnamed protein product [Malus baccata var. baccata]